ncbi:hypothetical protein CGRA01v4_01110 [Colletotrichum graminicola]|nr:hypothetical protein CGRA01v4_01110 [Colletotrichum graminicola]
MPFGRPATLSGTTQVRRQTQGSCTFLLPPIPDYKTNSLVIIPEKRHLSRSHASVFRPRERDQPECPIHASPTPIRTFPHLTSFPRLSNRPSSPSHLTRADTQLRNSAGLLSTLHAHLNFSLPSGPEKKLLHFFSHSLFVFFSLTPRIDSNHTSSQFNNSNKPVLSSFSWPIDREHQSSPRQLRIQDQLVRTPLGRVFPFPHTSDREG